MKKFSNLIAWIAILAATNVYAEPVCIATNGMMTCGSGTIDSINFVGIVNMDGTNVINKLDVTGNVEILNARLNHIVIKGQNYIVNSEIQHETDIKGDIHAENVKFIGPIKLTGNLRGNNISFDLASLTGTVKCANCIFNNKTTIIGNAYLKNSKLSNTLIINTIDSKFENTSLKDIIVKRNRDKNQSQSINLINSHVYSITFESGNGIINKDKTSKITGQVTGAKVIEH